MDSSFSLHANKPFVRKDMHSHFHHFAERSVIGVSTAAIEFAASRKHESLDEAQVGRLPKDDAASIKKAPNSQHTREE